jgi:hypothetical protein
MNASTRFPTFSLITLTIIITHSLLLFASIFLAGSHLLAIGEMADGGM